MAKSPSVDWFNEIELNDFDNIKIDFAVSVERAMNRAEIKRIDLAKELQVTPSRITKVLSGDANLTIEMMHKIAKALGHKVSIHLSPQAVNTNLYVITSSNNVPLSRIVQSAQVLPMREAA